VAALRSQLGALLMACLAGVPAWSKASDADLTGVFGDYGGCALLVSRDRYGEDRIEFRPGECRIPRSPCSTFKIPNALIGLSTGVVSGPDALKSWDGVNRERDITNQDHTLASAMAHSVVWYFQRMARDIGPPTMQFWLDRLAYGNRDISGGIDRFWLGSSLTIDGFGQLGLIQDLWRSALPFPTEAQQQVRNMLKQSSDLPGTLYGKTGSCRGSEETGAADHGWFIGWIDWDKRNAAGPATSWFVFQVSGPEAWGWEARRIALSVLAAQTP
jgi:beta-lactamase class D